MNEIVPLRIIRCLLFITYNIKQPETHSVNFMFISLKLEKEQVEEKLKRSEREKQRLEKSLIQARASANKAKTDLEKKEIENTTIKNQIKDLQQELKDSKETEEKFKVL